MDGGEQVARALSNAGVDRVAVLTGGHITPVIEACDELDMAVTAHRDERMAGFMAAGQGVIDRDPTVPGVCLVTAGPGHTNAYSALTQAHESGYPLLSISGQYEREARGRGALQEVDQVAMVEEISKWAKRVEDSDRLVRDTEEAIRQAVTPPRGHAHLSMPVDVLATEREPSAVTLRDPERYLHLPDKPPKDTDIERVLDTLTAADRPALVTGGGLWFRGVTDELTRFVEQTGAPVFTHEESRGLIPDSHDRCFGSPIYKLTGAARRLSDADCVVFIDVTLDWRMDYGEPPMLPEPDAATFIEIAETGGTIGEKAPVDIPIVADARSALDALSTAAADRHWPRYDDWAETLSEASESFRADYRDHVTAEGSPVNPGRLTAELADAISPETRVVFDGGNIGKWAKFSISAERPGCWLRLKGPFACIGYGFPTVMAVQQAHPEDDVVLMTGDGAFGFNALELETAVQEDLPVTCIVANNGGWGSVGGDEVPVATELPQTPFHELADSLGGTGLHVTESEGVRPAIEKALAANEVTVVNVETTDPYAPVDYPKTLKGY